ncbi:hypothetical protein ETC03_21700 [Geobacillus sp. MMMUD3]|uniref:Uncharacterized protein n=2 Tax=Brevibacterium casei TaxID=33889 RepID=K9B3I4_9MICO|nr:hypothetical protein [Brevibacterium casei]EKU48330.1 hypothetical protein C272_05459 [Brevibacterium casei S18]NNV08794.1 hypothetical protein [Geobacillus sp. MMMUD3]QQT70093.1 hypothetical protein I6I57_04070 [Brevibacterium casei]QZE25677.1 hypothetical protein K4X33_17315 [Brevibacterium casei]
MMSDREQFRLDARVWTIAVIGMVIGGVVGLLIWGPLQMIPFAMIGFALGLAIAWMLPRSTGSGGGHPGSNGGSDGGPTKPGDGPS